MARKKNTPSTIDKLLPDIQSLIKKLRDDGRTIDEIRAKLLELDVEVSRSALGRHVKSLADMQQRMRDSHAMAKALTSHYGDKPVNELADANFQLMHSVVMQTLTASDVDPETGESAPIMFNPQEAMFLAKSLQSLAGAQKTNTDRLIRAREEAAKEAAKAVDRVAKKAAAGLTKETVADIKREILGITK